MMPKSEPRTAICELLVILLEERGYDVHINPGYGFDSIYYSRKNPFSHNGIHINNEIWNDKKGSVRFPIPDIEDPSFDPEEFLNRLTQYDN